MRVLQAILISFGIHFLLVLVLQNWPIPDSSRKSSAVEFDVVSPRVSQKETTKQIVTQALVPEKNRVQEAEDKLRFLSDKFQRVKEQSKAALSGLTENRDSLVQKSAGRESRIKASPNKASSKLDPYSTVQQRMVPERSDSSQDSRSSSGFSTIAESVDVKVGTMTALNTDQYLFYSFYRRINELVYLRWSYLIQAAEERVAARVAGTSGNDKWTTNIEILLRPTGEFHSAQIMKESGIREFDQSAILAFKQAGLFPNPPQELVEEDGLIHLKYNLTVFFDPKSLVRR
jgi:TonB family protein